MRQANGADHEIPDVTFVAHPPETVGTEHHEVIDAAKHASILSPFDLLHYGG